MKTIQSILLILTFGPIFNSCKKENVGHYNDSSTFECENYDWTLPIGTSVVEFYEDSIQYKFPAINPNNPNEIVYMKQDYINDTYQLIKYNYQTQQSLVLVNNIQINNQPSWSVNGKIAFQYQIGQIYIISDNGFNLTPFAVDYFDSHPFWSSNGELLLWLHVDQSTQMNYLLRKNMSTSIVDTLIHNTSNSFSLSSLNQLLVASGTNFYSLDVSSGINYTPNDLNLVTDLLPAYTQGMCWHPDGTKFYVCKFVGQNYNDMGLFEIELATGITTKLLDFCDKRWYEKVVCTADGKSIIGERIECYQELDGQDSFTGNAYRYSSIYKINLQTLSELKISP